MIRRTAFSRAVCYLGIICKPLALVLHKQGFQGGKV